MVICQQNDHGSLWLESVCGLRCDIIKLPFPGAIRSQQEEMPGILSSPWAFPTSLLTGPFLPVAAALRMCGCQRSNSTATVLMSLSPWEVASAASVRGLREWSLMAGVVARSSLHRNSFTWLPFRSRVGSFSCPGGLGLCTAFWICNLPRFTWPYFHKYVRFICYGSYPDNNT